MLPITTQIYGPYQEFRFGGRFDWKFQRASVSKVRESIGYPVESFRELMDYVSDVTVNNKVFEIFYRGQNNDYLDRNKKTKIYPSICRPEPGKIRIQKKEIEQRYEAAYAFMQFQDKSKKQWDEYHFAHYQHYDMFKTPLIDITQSLRIAATFALFKHGQRKLLKEGFVYVFGLPYPTGSISHFIDQQILLLKLQNVVPKESVRPRYQEGYLVGKLPIKATKAAGDNLARRLIAKFKLLNTSGNFFDKSFPTIPPDVLFPDPDAGFNDLTAARTYFENELYRQSQKS